jgi:hypothetical protein
LFKELTGKDWHSDSIVDLDPEEKITEFNYEKFIPAALLEHYSHMVGTPEFKKVIKYLNYTSKTEFEKLMPLFRELDEKETEILIHRLKSLNRS